MLKIDTLRSAVFLREANLPISIECIVETTDRSFLGREQFKTFLCCPRAKDDECRSIGIEMQWNCRSAVRDAIRNRLRLAGRWIPQFRRFPTHAKCCIANFGAIFTIVDEINVSVIELAVQKH